MCGTLIEAQLRPILCSPPIPSPIHAYAVMQHAYIVVVGWLYAAHLQPTIQKGRA